MAWSSWNRDVWNWSPWQEMRRLQDEMNRVFQGYLPRSGRVEFPPLNVEADSDKVIVTAEIPGIKPADLDISVLNDTLSLKGRREAPPLAEGERQHRQERPHGEFARTVMLPYRVDAESVEAGYARGVLTVTLQRSPEDKPKRISIRTQA